MKKNKIKLVIWDFDGVIADTEELYLINRQKLLNKFFNLNWSLETTKEYVGGRNNKSANENLKKHGILTNNDYWTELGILDRNILKNGFSLIPNIVNVVRNINVPQCLATGGDIISTRIKIKIAGLEDVFKRNNIFTVNMVKRGKPEPDLFLLAADKMGYTPENCLVIEDSIAGLTAAKKAGIETIAFVGSKVHNNPSYRKKISDLGFNVIFDDMLNLHKYLKERC